ncbi:hypothetical protein HZ326_31899, partial [Fusarium oxysporum f. sp. albedinis]
MAQDKTPRKKQYTTGFFFFFLANGFITPKCGANKMVGFLWSGDFLCYALSGVPRYNHPALSSPVRSRRW